MQPVNAAARRYDPVTILLHWTVAILVLAQWLGAHAIDYFPRGPYRIDARSVHIVLGVLITLLLAGRLVWRATRGRRLPKADTGAAHLLAKATHWGLYALIAAMVLVGIALTWVRGDSIFNLFQIPAFSPGDHALEDRVQNLHASIGWLILALALLHATAALIHRMAFKDGVLDRMLPERLARSIGRVPAPPAAPGVRR